MLASVQVLGEVRGLGATAREAVDHARAVRSRHGELRAAAVSPAEEPEARERVLEAFDPLDPCLAVVRAEDDCVAVEKRIGPPGRVEQRAHRPIRPCERGVGAFRP